MPVEPNISDLTPEVVWPPRGAHDVLQVIDAVYPPTRRRIMDVLRLHGSMPLSELARLSKLTEGSLCNNLRDLYRVGAVLPDPEHSDEFRRSWWRSCATEFWWSTDEFPVGSPERKRLEQATIANVRHQFKGLIDFLTNEPSDTAWRANTGILEELALATPKEMEDLLVSVDAAVSAWRDRTLAAREADPEVEAQMRRPVRFVGLLSPVD